MKNDERIDDLVERFRKLREGKGGIQRRADDERISDLVQRAQTLLNPSGTTEGDGKALVLRRDSLPARVPALCNKTALGPAQHQHRAVSRIEGPPVIELPRWCAVYDGEKWLARYILRNGEHEFNAAIELTKRQQVRYPAESLVALPAGFELDSEQCPCCSVWTPDYAVGAVYCNRCYPIPVCFGRTSRDRYFMCRDSCGEKGPLSPRSADDRVAFIPGRSAGNFGVL
jgi:hypothetical protein